MMLDAKNLEIADVIFDWVSKNVPANGKRAVTRRPAKGHREGLHASD